MERGLTALACRMSLACRGYNHGMIATRNLRRARVLIVGCGDVGMRAVPLFTKRAAAPRVIALTSHPGRVAELRAAGTTPIVGDLDDRASLARLAGLSSTVVHLAPPQKEGDGDRRTRALIATLCAKRRSVARATVSAVAPHRVWRAWFRANAENRSARVQNPARTAPIVPDEPFAIARRRPPIRLVYASTTGVYGDCGGALIDETRPVRPANARAKRRVSAESQLRRAAVRGGWRVSIVRIPGIYAANRLPLARIEKGMPALVARDDVFTNHIHADDLAAILVRAIRRAKPQRAINATDDTDLPMGDYFDRVADAKGMPRVPRITREAAEAQLEPLTLSFMRESRRLTNARLKRELGYALRYPTVDDFLRAR
ncbi:NAD-dependent epimerase/dehydratase [Caballeronia telluris]|uniref:NAD-dependent epimerase/dehydratase n=2 Tax=Caballeronia telluris TaxID=326475 RepID=A0A158HXE4_9BURK|nr:NAD-dependent epimerase/dehydratase [Caballeronia telluris]